MLNKAVASILLLAAVGVAQTTHQHHAPPVVKGQDHPEKITDQRAWLLNLLSVTYAPPVVQPKVPTFDNNQAGQDVTSQQKMVQFNRLEAGLINDASALDDFRSRLDRFQIEYNQAVEGVNDPEVVADAYALWQKQLHQLANDMAQYFHRNHSDVEWKHINEHIQSMKATMVYTEDKPDDAATFVPAAYHGSARLRRAQLTGAGYGTAGYTQYAAFATDGTYWYQTVYTYGASNVTWTCNLVNTGPGGMQWVPPGCNPNGPPTHTFYATNQVASSGPRAVNIGGYAATTAVNLSYGWQFPIAQIKIGDILIGLEIYCQQVGKFFFGLLALTARAGNEYLAWDHTAYFGQPGAVACGATPVCANGRPWIVDLSSVVQVGPTNLQCAPAWTCWGACVRAAPGYPWTCTGSNNTDAICAKLWEGPPNPPQNCTAHP